MNNLRFTEEDFHTFTIEGLDARMGVLKETVRPKLQGLGEHFAPVLSVLTGDEMFVHVAKHARRSVNPPDDSWVAFANNKRGYKKLPHFQIGLWKTHVFVWFALIYESPSRKSTEGCLKNTCQKSRAGCLTAFSGPPTIRNPKPENKPTWMQKGSKSCLTGLQR
ncbi:UPF0637 protein YktB [Bacillus sonorensis]|uniref:UPF0637 protein YktB n=1 Tax=Bacillus sonorensis TaxID=119858 RepID=A0ABN5AK26_9BACI|nr:UPF0637 protein YktB [Bacillus sonorensis]